MSKVKQTIPKELIVRALKNYKNLLLDLKSNMGEDSFNQIQHYSDDLFDLYSEITLLENSNKIEITFDKTLYESFNQYSINGVDYPKYSNKYPLYEIKEETQTIKRTIHKKIKIN
jgi:hypothetical protein